MSSPIRIGLVGLGRAGASMHCPELAGKADKFQIVAACDVIPERLTAMAEKYGCATYEQIETLIADPEVEVVDIATRSCDHFDQALLALQAGKIVFLEKPMCATYEQALKLQAAADGRLYIRHNRRFEPAFIQIREIIASGVLGEVFEIKLSRVGYQRRDDWQTIKQFSGGQLLNWGPHIIDHALRLLEAPVADLWSSLKLVTAVGDAEDHLKIVLTGTNGRVVDLEISGGAALGAPEWVVWGTRGALTCSGNEIKLKYLDPAVPLEDRQADPGTPGATFGSAEELRWIEETLTANPPTAWGIWDALYAAIREGQPFPVTLEEAVGVMEIVSKVKQGTPFA